MRFHFYFKFLLFKTSCTIDRLISLPKGRRRKIEVPTDTQPQFDLGDTAADIERRRREREERDEREKIEQEERDRERMEREREESPERGEKRVGTETDTDVESTQSRQKKGQMKS